MQIESIAECSKGHSAIRSTFIKLLFVIYHCQAFTTGEILASSVLLAVVWFTEMDAVKSNNNHTI